MAAGATHMLHNKYLFEKDVVYVWVRKRDTTRLCNKHTSRLTIDFQGDTPHMQTLPAMSVKYWYSQNETETTPALPMKYLSSSVLQ